MITFHTSADVTEERTVTVTLPPETPLGEVRLAITVESKAVENEKRGTLKQFFGAVSSGDPNSADNDRIDADLARVYEES